MKKDIHPNYNDVEVVCTGCSAKFTTRSTMKVIRLTICSNCHPFFTGTEKFVDTEGRIDKFKAKYAKFQKTA